MIKILFTSGAIMGLSSAVRLVILAAIWGASFLFMRITAPDMGAALIAELRVLLAAIFLLVVSIYLKRTLAIQKYWRHYLIVGFFNSALPFLLFCYAALNISASLLAILNATAPVWGCLITALVERKSIPLRTFYGLVLGILGVILVLGFDLDNFDSGTLLPCLAAIAAAISYGVASTYTRYAASVDAYRNAHGTMWAAAIVLLPLVFVTPEINISPVFEGWVLPVSVLSLGIVCTGIAYLLYFRLIKDVGPASALTVTFLVPVFGVLWGALLLDEKVGWHTLLGGAIVIFGTALVTGFSFKSLFKGKSVHV